MKTLDRKRPFGEVCGVASHRYEQDGLCFDAQGNLVGEEPKQAPVEKEETTDTLPHPATMSDDALKVEIKAAGGDVRGNLSRDTLIKRVEDIRNVAD